MKDEEGNSWELGGTQERKEKRASRIARNTDEEGRGDE
jgi:hypothetical protein